MVGRIDENGQVAPKRAGKCARTVKEVIDLSPSPSLKRKRTLGQQNDDNDYQMPGDSSDVEILGSPAKPSGSSKPKVNPKPKPGGSSKPKAKPRPKKPAPAKCEEITVSDFNRLWGQSLSRTVKEIKNERKGKAVN